MKIKWGKRSYTVVIIPDANRSVVRFRMPPFMVSVLSGAVMSILLFAVFVLVQYLQTQRYNTDLQTKLDGSALSYQQAITDKNGVIETLQNEVIELSKHAENVSQQIEQIQKFEEDLRSISNMKNGAVSQADTTKTAESTGIGGAPIPVSANEDLKGLTGDAVNEYSQLNDRMKELQSSLTEIRQKVLEEQEKLRVTPSIWPTDIHTISSGYGYRIDPITFKPSFHDGLDIGAHLGDPVSVTADGKVAFTGKDSLRGNNIIVDHANGIRTWYMHLSKIIIETGDTVQKGQTIGLVGSTGRATGPHLHYQIVQDGKTVDPRSYLPATRKEE